MPLITTGTLSYDDELNQWFVTEKYSEAVFKLHPDDVEDPMFCLTNGMRVTFVVTVDKKNVVKLNYAKIMTVL